MVLNMYLRIGCILIVNVMIILTIRIMLMPGKLLTKVSYTLAVKATQNQPESPTRSLHTRKRSSPTQTSFHHAGMEASPRICGTCELLKCGKCKLLIW